MKRGPKPIDPKITEEKINNAFKETCNLVSKGLNASRFKTKGMGPNDPIDSNETIEGRSRNRRVEFTITANQKMIKEAEQEVKN